MGGHSVGLDLTNTPGDTRLVGWLHIQQVACVACSQRWQDGIAAGSMSSRQVHGPTVLELIPCGAVPRVALWPASTGYATLNLGLALAILDQRPFAISCTHSVLTTSRPCSSRVLTGLLKRIHEIEDLEQGRCLGFDFDMRFD